MCVESRARGKIIGDLAGEVNMQSPEGHWETLSMGVTWCMILEDYLAALYRTSGEEP